MKLYKVASSRECVNSKRTSELSLTLLIFTTVGTTALLLLVHYKPSQMFQAKDNKLKYILEWAYSLTYMGHFAPLWFYQGQNLFLERNCLVKDCYLTHDRSLFGDISQFDAVIFHAQSIIKFNYFPPKRSPHQKYIFATVEPSSHTKNWSYDFKNFYNWTMTYRLDSDIPFTYMTIRDENWNIVGPKENMHWMYSDEIRKINLNEKIKAKLQHKSKAVAWIVSHCISPSKRENIVAKLEKELTKYGLSIDIFGDCGPLECSREQNNKCLEMIKTDYYFYISFENSICEDYVTEKLLKPLRYSAIPIVYGGAKYTRFMPDGIYLDARIISAEELAKFINELINDEKKYFDYFKWRNFYSYHIPEEYSDSDPFCQLCAKLHSKDFEETKVYNDFIGWWNRGDEIENINISTRLVDGHIISMDSIPKTCQGFHGLSVAQGDCMSMCCGCGWLGEGGFYLPEGLKGAIFPFNKILKLHLCSFICVFCSSVALILVAKNKPNDIFHSKDKKLKYILEWVYSLSYSGHFAPMWFYRGQSLFTERNCSVKNCFITYNRAMFQDITEFDAILFHAIYLMPINYFPPKRALYQKYIFASSEPPAYTKDWKYNFRNFYNWTMTYRLDSDIPFPYMTIRDRHWNIVGPKVDMNWKNSDEIRYADLDESVKAKLQYKSKAAAWIVSNCFTDSKREEVVEKLQRELFKYGLTIDIYGDCYSLQCSQSEHNEYLEMIKRDYYFYLSFENCLADDYVTEKLVRSLRYSAVPVVYSGADYSRFMPDGIYLDARKLGVEELARQMNELMQDREKYYQYFKWRNFYSYHSPEEYSDSDPFCHLCAKLHNEDALKESKVYTDIIRWWNGDKLLNKTYKSIEIAVA